MSIYIYMGLYGSIIFPMKIASYHKLIDMSP